MRTEAAGAEEKTALVLMASYNGAAYIREQIESILSQQGVNLRLLVSDDGSSDGTREILSEYERRYPGRVLLRHRNGPGKEERLPAAAGNFFWLIKTALKEVPEAGYFLLSDQDDVWFPCKAQRLMEAMEKAAAFCAGDCPVLIHSDMEVVDRSLRLISPSLFQHQGLKAGRHSFSEVLVENPVTGGAVMMNRALAELAKMPPETCMMHDWWLALLAACFGTLVFVPESLYQYRQHGDNVLGAGEGSRLLEFADRPGRSHQVKERYRQMFLQAEELERMYGERMETAQREILKAYLALPRQFPLQRLFHIIKYRFYKSSRLQTLAQCLTIPGETE